VFATQIQCAPGVKQVITVTNVKHPVLLKMSLLKQSI